MIRSALADAACIVLISLPSRRIGLYIWLR